MSQAGGAGAPIPMGTCPICRERLTRTGAELPPHYPFCSRRCRLIDLGSWLRESYAVPADAAEDDDAIANADPPSPV